MINRRTVFFTLIYALLAGCSTPLVAPVAAPAYQWGEKVEFGGLSFTFNSAQYSQFFIFGGNQRADSDDGFVILDMSMKNNGAATLTPDFQPVIRLLDDAGRLYEHSQIRTVQFNFGKSSFKTGFESVNPNTTLRNVFVFEAPKGRYRVQVMVPERLRMAFAGSMEKRGPYFTYDISSQL